MKKLLKFCNDNHWFIIATVVLGIGFFWLYGCQSTVPSMIDGKKQITRAELELESDFLIGQIRVKMENLDQQDEIKRLILDQAAIFGQTGTFNPLGLLNSIISIGAISFGLNRNQKLNAALKTTKKADNV